MFSGEENGNTFNSKVMFLLNESFIRRAVFFNFKLENEAILKTENEMKIIS